MYQTTVAAYCNEGGTYSTNIGRRIVLRRIVVDGDSPVVDGDRTVTNGTKYTPTSPALHAQPCEQRPTSKQRTLICGRRDAVRCQSPGSYDMLRSLTIIGGSCPEYSMYRKSAVS